MNKILLEKAYKKLTQQKQNLIKTGFKPLDEKLSYCTYGNIISFAGTLNHELFLNLVREFSIQNKKCLYFFEDYKHERFLMELLTLNSSFYDDNKEVAKDKMQNWQISLYDNKFSDIKDFHKIIETEKPDYIFIDALNNIKIQSPLDTELSETDYFLEQLKMSIQETNSIALIKTGEVMFEGIDTNLLNSRILKNVSDIIIATSFSSEQVYSFWTLKNINLNSDAFSLKYDFKHYRFNEIEVIRQ